MANEMLPSTVNGFIGKSYPIKFILSPLNSHNSWNINNYNSLFSLGLVKRAWETFIIIITVLHIEREAMLLNLFNN